jgi:putative ABC transport system permease protein
VTRTLYLAWRYLAFHRFKTVVLVTSITLILFLPVGLRVLVNQSSDQLTARALATPLVVGAKGSPLELVLNTLYFGGDTPEEIRYEAAGEIVASGFATAIPVHTRFRARTHPIVGTTLEYFSFRGLEVERGRQLVSLGECVLGARAASALGAGAGDYVVSSPESVFDIAGVYPLKMAVVGVLAFSDSPDDDAVFVDLKTAWVIQGLGHGHQDLTLPEADSGVLRREEGNVVANASVVQYNEITPSNIDSFHFHGDLSEFPVTAVIAVPTDPKASAILQGRFEADDQVNQIVRPAEVMDDLLATILTIQGFVVAGAIILGLATLATAALVFLLSLRLRKREIATLFKIGGSRISVAMVMASEIVVVLVAGAVLASLLTMLTSHFGSFAIRTLVRMWA